MGDADSLSTKPIWINKHNGIPTHIRIQIQSAFESDRVFADKPADVGIIIPSAHVVKIIGFGLYAKLSGVFERLRYRFAFRHQPAVRVVGVAIDDLTILIGDRDRVPGAVEVVGVELVGTGIDKADESVAVDIVAGDLVTVIDFGEQIAGGVVDVFCGGAAARRSDAVAGAVIDVLVVAALDQPVGAVEGKIRAVFVLLPAFVVVAEGCLGRSVQLRGEQPVLLCIVGMALAPVDQRFRFFRFFDHSFDPVAVVVEGVLVIGQGLADGAVLNAGQPVGFVQGVIGDAAIK